MVGCLLFFGAQGAVTGSTETGLVDTEFPRVTEHAGLVFYGMCSLAAVKEECRKRISPPPFLSHGIEVNNLAIVFLNPFFHRQAPEEAVACLFP